MNADEVRIPAGQLVLQGNLWVPEPAQGLVIFAHGSGSGRHSPRNRFVAELLQQAGLATLLMDLLTLAEERLDRRTAELRFDIELLGDRLISALTWCHGQRSLRTLPLGLFGSSTGAAAALIAAADRPERLRAVVSRGGRPDLAADSLSRVQAATLLIVGGEDGTVIDLNRQAMAAMRSLVKLEIIPGATHLFEEPGALETVGGLAVAWFRTHLASGS